MVEYIIDFEGHAYVQITDTQNAVQDYELLLDGLTPLEWVDPELGIAKLDGEGVIEVSLGSDEAFDWDRDLTFELLTPTQAQALLGEQFEENPDLGGADFSFRRDTAGNLLHQSRVTFFDTTGARILGGERNRDVSAGFAPQDIGSHGVLVDAQTNAIGFVPQTIIGELAPVYSSFDNNRSQVAVEFEVPSDFDKSYLNVRTYIGGVFAGNDSFRIDSQHLGQTVRLAVEGSLNLDHIPSGRHEVALVFSDSDSPLDPENPGDPTDPENNENDPTNGPTGTENPNSPHVPPNGNGPGSGPGSGPGGGGGGGEECPPGSELECPFEGVDDNYLVGDDQIAGGGTGTETGPGEEQEAPNYKTIRGTIEVVNRGGGDAATNEFGNRWSIEVLDRVVPFDGVGEHTSKDLGRPELGDNDDHFAYPTRGATNLVKAGQTLVRGDNSTLSTPSLEGERIEAELTQLSGAWLDLDGNSVSSGTDAPEYFYSEDLTATATWNLSDLNPNAQYEVFVSWLSSARNVHDAVYQLESGWILNVGDQLDHAVDQRFHTSALENGRSLGHFLAENGEIQIVLSTSVPQPSGEQDGNDDFRLAAGRVWVREIASAPVFHHSASNLQSREPGTNPESLPNPEVSYEIKNVRNNRVQQFDRQGVLIGSYNDVSPELVTRFAYTDSDQDTLFDELQSITDPLGLTVAYAYSSGRLSQITATNGQIVSYNIEGTGNLIEITNPSLSIYSSNINIQPEATSYQFSYWNDEISKVDQPSGALIELGTEYVSYGTEVDWHWSVWRHWNSEAFGGVVLAEDFDQVYALKQPFGLGRWHYQVDDFGYVTARFDPIYLGQGEAKTEFVRFDNGQIDYILGPQRATGRSRTDFGYDGSGRIASKSQQGGATESWGYNDQAQLVSHHSPEGVNTSYSIDGLTTTVTIGNTPVRVETLDSYRRPLSVTQNYQGGSYTTDYEYYDVSVPGEEAFHGLLKRKVHNGGGSEVRFTTYQYDSNRHLSVETISPTIDPFHSTEFTRTIQYLHDEYGRVVSVIQPGTSQHVSPMTEYAYDAAGRQIAVLVNQRDLSEWIYSGDRLQSKKDPLVSVSSGSGIGVQSVRPTTTYAYNFTPQSRKLAVTGPTGEVANQTLDQRGRTRFETSSTKNVLYDYDAAGNRVRKLEDVDFLDGQPHSIETHYEYDLANRLTREFGNRDAETTRSYSYQSGSNRLASRSDLGPNGLVSTTFGFDSFGRLTSTTAPRGSGQSTITQGYDTAGNLISETDGAGNTTTYTVNSFGLKTSISKPSLTSSGSAVVVTYAYDYLGNRISESVVAPNSNGQILDGVASSKATTYFVNDNLGRVVQVLAPDHQTGVLQQNSTSFVFDVHGNLLSETNAAGRTTSYSHDERGQVTRETNGLSETVHHRYDILGNKVLSRDARGNDTKSEYDSLGRLTKLTLPSIEGVGSSVTTYAYMPFGNPDSISKTGPNGVPQTTEFHYDSWGRLIQEVTPTHTTSRTFFSNHLLKSETVSDNLNISPQTEKHLTYYDSGLTKTETDASTGNTVTYAYNGNGQITSISDTKGSSHSIQYNGRGLKSAESSLVSTGLNSSGNPINTPRTRSWAYYQDGQIKSYKDRDERIAEFQYDYAGNMVSRLEQDSSGQTVESRILAYTADGLIENASNNHATYSVTARDAFGRVKQVSQSIPEWNIQYQESSQGTTFSSFDLQRDFDTSIHYTYDANSNPLNVTFTDHSGAQSNRQINRQFDALNRVTQVEKTGNTTSLLTTEYLVDGSPSRVITQENGTQVDKVEKTYFDSGRLKEADNYHYRADGTYVSGSEKDITYGSGSRIETTVIDSIYRADQTHTRTVNYSSTGKVTDDRSQIDSNPAQETFQFAIVDETEKKVGLDDRVLDDGFYTYEYDGEGNIAKRTAKDTIVLDAHDAVALGVLTLTGDWSSYLYGNAFRGKQFYTTDDEASFSWDFSNLPVVLYDVYMTWATDSTMDTNSEGKVTTNKGGTVDSFVLDLNSVPSSDEVYEGQDFEKVSSMVGGITTMVVSPTQFSPWTTGFALDAIMLKIKPTGTPQPIVEEFESNIDGNVIRSSGKDYSGATVYSQDNAFDFQNRLVASTHREFAPEAGHGYLESKLKESRYIYDASDQVDEHHFEVYFNHLNGQEFADPDSEKIWSQQPSVELAAADDDFAENLAKTLVKSNNPDFRENLDRVFVSFLEQYGNEGKTKLQSIVEQGYRIVEQDHWWDYVSYTGKVISIDFGGNPDGAKIAEVARYLNDTLNDIRFLDVAGYGGYFAYHIGSFVGVTQLVEGAAGLDLLEQRELSTQESFFRIGMGALSLGLTIATGGTASAAAKSAIKIAHKAAVKQAGKVLSTRGSAIFAREFAKKLLTKTASAYGNSAMLAFSGAGAGAIDNATSVYLSGGSLSQVLQASAMGAMMGLRNPKMAFAGLAGGIAGAAIGQASGIGASNGYVLGGIAGSIGFGTGAAWGRMANQGFGSAAGYAAKYAAAHGGFVAGGAAIGGIHGGWDGALQGAIYGDMVGSMATPMFVKCFVAGTPVLVPVDIQQAPELAMVEPIVATNGESWNRWKLTVAGLIVPIGVAQFFAARRRAAEQSREKKSAILTPWEFGNPNQKLIYGMD